MKNTQIGTVKNKKIVFNKKYGSNSQMRGNYLKFNKFENAQ